MAKKIIATKDAVGYVVAHDMTKIVPGSYKGPAFKKGHLITQDDIPHLLDMGKEHIYALTLSEDELHEDEAIKMMAALVSGKNIYSDPPAEGRINLRAAKSGLLQVNVNAVDNINQVQDAILSTRQNNQLVKQGDLVAAVKVVPLVVKKQLAEDVEKCCKNIEVLSILPMESKKLGLVIVAGEVFNGRIKDRFGPILKAKADKYGLEIIAETIAPDDKDVVIKSILEQANKGAEIIIASGGMSVDPDDITSAAIKETGATVVSYGTPVLPGGMFMLAYLGETVVMGLPGCGMESQYTVMDMLLPRILAGQKITKQDIAKMGYGGLCLHCSVCHYESCCFGRR